MSELLAFARLGNGHILDAAAADHLLFLLVLAAAYRPAEWRSLLAVVSAFTVGHSATLALVATGVILPQARLIEFLIPCTIVAAALANLAGPAAATSRLPRAHRWLLAALFGLVHGAGFASYLRELFVSRVALPLFGFNLGIELGQLLVLAIMVPALAAAAAAITRLRPRDAPIRAHRLCVVAVSLVALAAAGDMALARRPW